MTDPNYEKLLEQSWRRPLTDVEQQALQDWLAAHPESRAAWETEAVLNQLLARLPDVPVASNFTARVLQSVQTETPRACESRPLAWWNRFGLAKRGAFAALFLCACLLVSWQVGHRRGQKALRIEIADSVAAVSKVPLVQNPEILEDFDAIQAMARAPGPDADLLGVLEK